MPANTSESKKRLETEATATEEDVASALDDDRFVRTMKSRLFHNSQSRSSWNLKTLY